MSIFHTEAAAELKLHATTKLVLMSLCDDAAKETRIARPGIDKMRTWSGAGERRVQQILDELIGAGLLARVAFAYPGRRAEFLVFPTEEEYAALDEKDPRLNYGRPITPQPVDNSDEEASEMGAVGFGRPENGCNPEPNACNLGFTPPVSTPGTGQSGPVPNVTTEQPVDNSAGTGTGPNPNTITHTAGQPLHHADVFAAIGNWLPTDFTDELLDALAAEILTAAKSVVLDRTGYVIRSIRNTVNPAERRRGRWLLRADELAADARAIRERAAGF